MQVVVRARRPGARQNPPTPEPEPDRQAVQRAEGDGHRARRSTARTRARRDVMSGPGPGLVGRATLSIGSSLTEGPTRVYPRGASVAPAAEGPEVDRPDRPGRVSERPEPGPDPPTPSPPRAASRDAGVPREFPLGDARARCDSIAAEARGEEGESAAEMRWRLRLGLDRGLGGPRIGPGSRTEANFPQVDIHPEVELGFWEAPGPTGGDSVGWLGPRNNVTNLYSL